MDLINLNTFFNASSTPSREFDFFPSSVFEEHEPYNLLLIGLEYVLTHVEITKESVYGVETMHIV
jgi:hypothetical protein